MLGEASTTEIARRSDALGFDENRTSAKEGGKIAGNARKALEDKTGKKVVSKTNYLAAPTPGLLDAPEPAAPSKPKVRVKPKLPKGA
jgi:predicted P-loop ATPase/GTPase